MTMPTYQATHLVPPQGMRAWTSPDPNAAPVDILSGGLDVQLLQRFGGWAQVQCSNGWQCWVDGNALQPIGAAPPAAPAYAAAPAAPAATTGATSVVAPFSILAGALVVLSTFLPWFSTDGIDLNAFKFPIDFLWTIDSVAKEDASASSIGGLIVLVGLALMAMAFVRNQVARRITGGVAAFLCVDYVIEVTRSLNDTPGAPGLFSVLGFGVYIALVGAALGIADVGSKR